MSFLKFMHQTALVHRLVASVSFTSVFMSLGTQKGNLIPLAYSIPETIKKKYGGIFLPRDTR